MVVSNSGVRNHALRGMLIRCSFSEPDNESRRQPRLSRLGEILNARDCTYLLVRSDVIDKQPSLLEAGDEEPQAWRNHGHMSNMIGHISGLISNRWPFRSTGKG